MDITGHEIRRRIFAAIEKRDWARRARLNAAQDYYRIHVWARFPFAPERQVTLAEAIHYANGMQPLSFEQTTELSRAITRAESITLTFEAPYDSLLA